MTFEDKERMFSVIRTILENPRGMLALRMSQKAIWAGLEVRGMERESHSKSVMWVKFGHPLNVLVEN